MRILVVALLVLNGALWAWWQGYLSPIWDAPGQVDREPSRVARQIKPEAVTVLTPGVRGAAAARAAGSAAATTAAPAASGAAPVPGR